MHNSKNCACEHDLTHTLCMGICVLCTRKSVFTNRCWNQSSIGPWHQYDRFILSIHNGDNKLDVLTATISSTKIYLRVNLIVKSIFVVTLPTKLPTNEPPSKRCLRDFLAWTLFRSEVVLFVCRSVHHDKGQHLPQCQAVCHVKVLTYHRGGRKLSIYSAESA